MCHVAKVAAGGIAMSETKTLNARTELPLGNGGGSQPKDSNGN